MNDRLQARIRGRMTVDLNGCWIWQRMAGQQLVALLATEGPLSWADLKRRAGLHPKVLSEMLATAGQAKRILKVDGLYQAVGK